MGRSVAIIGAGVGGLATALRLAHRGANVTVFEKTNQVGGRNRRESVNDCLFDGGPTLLMMLDPFVKLYKDVGESFEKEVPHHRCDPSYRAFWRDGSRIDATTNILEMKRRLAALAGTQDASVYEAFVSELRDLYAEAIPHFVRKNYIKFGDVASLAQVRRVAKHHMLSNLYRRVQKRFSDERLRMLFSFQTMYLGLSPFTAPWVYSTLAYMEYGEGIYYPTGGLPRISESIAALAQARGVTIRTECPVQSIHGSAIHLESGESLSFDAIVANADMPYAQRELAREPVKRNLRYSCSGYLMYIDYEGSLTDLQHHNVFFGRDFKGNLEDIFTRLEIPEDPAFYVCISARTDPSVAPKGHLNLFVLVPCPNLDLPFTPEVESRLQSAVFNRLSEDVGFEPSKIRGIKARTPLDWQSELNLDKGAAFGLSHDLFQSAFMRPQNKSSVNPNLYFVGASTVPGNGLPMVLISAELVEERLTLDGVLT